MSSKPKPIELHIWSPAFDLPSFDPECLAAIAYLNIALPKQRWVLVESNNTSISPNGALPALKDDKQWIAGFDNIITHIQEKSNGRVYLDGGLDTKKQALSIAIRSLVQQGALPILSLSLYVCPVNWASIVRPMYSNFLPFPLQFSIPTQHYNLALRRTSHWTWINVKTFGYDDPATAPISATLANLTVPSFTSSDESEFGGEKIGTRVRLERLVRDFMEDIDVQLGSNDYLFGDGGPTSADCYLAGYLSLFVYPVLPYDFLAEITKKDFPSVCDYVERMRAHAFPDSEDLPWKKPDPDDALSGFSSVVDGFKGYFGGGSPGQRADDIPAWTRFEPVARAAGTVAAGALVAFIFRREGWWPAWLPFPIERTHGRPTRQLQIEHTPNPGELEVDLSADSFLGIRKEEPDLSADSFLGISR